MEINDTPYPVAYGTERADTAGVCGEEATASGFGLGLKWIDLGPGDREECGLPARMAARMVALPGREPPIPSPAA